MLDGCDQVTFCEWSKAGRKIGASGRGDWNRRRFGTDAVDEEPAVWCDGAGSADVCGRCRSSYLRCALGMLHPGTTRDAHRSAGGAAI